MNRDPDLRVKKQESLNKRYLLRRLDSLETELIDFPGESCVSRTRELVEQRMATFANRVGKLANVSSIERSEVEATPLGNSQSLRELILSISQPSPRSAIIVVKDRGNTERVFKILKREFPNLSVSLMDRERVELRQPTITDAIREERGGMVDNLISAARKELKKLELQSYDELKKSSLSDRDLQTSRSLVKQIFAAADSDLEAMMKTAMDELEIDFS
jgi:hypothetical protein